MNTKIAIKSDDLCKAIDHKTAGLRVPRTPRIARTGAYSEIRLGEG